MLIAETEKRTPRDAAEELKGTGRWERGKKDALIAELEAMYGKDGDAACGPYASALADGENLRAASDPVARMREAKRVYDAHRDDWEVQAAYAGMLRLLVAEAETDGAEEAADRLRGGLAWMALEHSNNDAVLAAYGDVVRDGLAMAQVADAAA